MKRIYFMKPVGMDGPIKIGCSKWPDHRILNISAWSPVPLEMMAVAEGNHTLERHLHRQFQRSHREWFHPTQDLLDGIKAVAGGASIEQAFGVVSRKKHERTKYPASFVYSKAAAA